MKRRIERIRRQRIGIAFIELDQCLGQILGMRLAGRKVVGLEFMLP